MAAPHFSSPASPARDAATSVVRSLREQGFVAYLAGGCVRDEVMGQAPKDYDVATDARPERVRQIFRNTQAVGEHFGVILVRERGCTVEVATFRHESGYADKRRPDSVTFTDAENDARRRDFTINGLLMDPVSGEVIDYVGGLADIAAGVIRAIGDPAARLGEDHLRALRAVRFAARFGFQIDPATAAAVRRDAAELRGVSRERIGQEIRLMLLDEHRGRATALLHELGLDGPVLDQPACNRPPDTVARLALEPAMGHLNIVIASLAAWAHDRGVESADTVRRWRQSLVLSNDERDGLRAVFEHLPRLQHEWSGMPVAARKRLAAGPWFGAALAVLGAVDPGQRDAVAAEVGRLSRHAGGLAPVPLVSGDDLVAAGYEPGPKFKQALDAVYDEQLEGRLTEPEQGLALAGRLLSQ
ncbi:MAG: CCA tRNA nucleotidyltransferase [Phycisphaerales bacterium]|nr:CCA tRNA nucleotidyltransferase [Phycisphaerales bacterium]